MAGVDSIRNDSRGRGRNPSGAYAFSWGGPAPQRLQSLHLKELMVMSKHDTVDSARAPYSEQRTEIVLLNR